MSILKYLKPKDILPDPQGDLSLSISPPRSTIYVVHDVNSKVSMIDYK